MPSIFVEDFAVDYRVLDSFGLRHQPASSARKVVADLRTFRRAYSIEIEDCNVGRQSRTQFAPVGHSEESRGLRGDSLDGVFERNGLLAAHEIADEIGGITGVAQHIDMGATVGNSDHRAWVTEFARDAFFINVEQRDHIGEIQIILDSEIEKYVERI